MFARRLPTTVTLPRLSAASSSFRAFHTTLPLSVKIGDPIPSTELHESSPGNKINLANELSSQKKALIIGVPGAFSPACSASHVPGYISHPALKNAGKVFVIGVNDAFVMKSWGEGLDPEGKSGVRFLADPQGEFTRELDLLFDAGKIFGNERSKRYALVVEEGRVKGAYVEPDNTGVDVSAAEKVLG